ncbi:helix-turn-helix domain-containing protein [Streptomyces huiliensis]|uniref:helix-turn-helix domain-containing protein n=1 Tax=Streptomyces huiliensis TaxID=2876027 RepID=UPI001CBE4FAB|nr:helix-turn-helix domain-containing protein [Streptomyces huiliensis]MBZ4323273.1 helix-turn-helix domain-containing protein [Streptomyces huiliensis]
MDIANVCWQRWNKVPVERAPHPALSAFVLSYLGFDEDTRAPVRRRLVASVAPFILVEFAAPGRHATGDGFPGPAGDTLLCGPIDTPRDIELTGRRRGVVAILKPAGASAFLGVPMREIVDRQLRCGELPGFRDAPRIAPRLASAHDWPTRFDLLDELLLRHTAQCREPSPVMVRAWHRLGISGGRIPIRHLAESVGVGSRQLEKLFREQAGCTPKKAARILRFHRALGLLTDTARSGDNLAAVAAHCGYSDHAHLSREVRALAGVPPTFLC